MSTNLIKIAEAAPIVWADATDYSDAVSGLTRTDQIDLTSVSAAAARQGAKHDFGAQRFASYLVVASVEIASLAASLELIDLYHAESVSGTAGNANPGGTSGTDAAYTGTAGDSLADSLAQLRYIGPLTATADNTTVVQYQVVGELSNILRFGMPVLVNGSTGALMTDAVEMFIAYMSMGPRIEASV